MNKHPMGWPLLYEYETPLGMICLYGKVMVPPPPPPLRPALLDISNLMIHETGDRSEEEGGLGSARARAAKQPLSSKSISPKMKQAPSYGLPYMTFALRGE